MVVSTKPLKVNLSREAGDLRTAQLFSCFSGLFVFTRRIAQAWWQHAEAQARQKGHLKLKSARVSGDQSVFLKIGAAWGGGGYQAPQASHRKGIHPRCVG